MKSTQAAASASGAPALPDNTRRPTTTAGGSAAVLFNTLRMSDWSHDWNIAADITPEEKAKTIQQINDYYFKERFDRSKKPISAHPYHHALILAALGSSSRLVLREFPFVVTPGYDRRVEACAHAYPHVHDPCRVSSFTKLASAYQKHHLTGLSGMTGLLISRLMTHPQFVSRKTQKKYTEITKQRTHSNFAAECITEGRYYTQIMRSSCGERPVGFIACDFKPNLTNNDITPDALRLTQDELRRLYDANIGRLMAMVKMFKRGFVGLAVFREDPEFVKMMTVFWRSSSQLLKLMEVGEHQSIPPSTTQDLHSTSAFLDRKAAKHVTMLSMVAETYAITPLLCQYDISQIFDSSFQSYSNFIKVTKETLNRLAEDGSTASFLAFSAIEPDMLTEHYAPKLGGSLGDYHTFTLKSCANHIPSRHPVFGALRVKHRRHIIRTADAVNASSVRVHPNLDAPMMGVTRDTKERFDSNYAPFYECVVEDVTSRDWRIDAARTFPATKNNTGIVFQDAEAAAVEEFKERVYPLGMKEPVVPRSRGLYDDYDDYYDYDDDYDDYDDYDDSSDSDDRDEDDDVCG
jgi:hypothetical protein